MEPVTAGKQGQELQLLEQLLENQATEFDLRSRELELESRKEDHAWQYSREALCVQERDRKHARECRRGERRDRQCLIMVITAVIALLIGGAMLGGHPEVALELAKAIILIVAGAAGGYGLARRKPDDAS